MSNETLFYESLSPKEKHAFDIAKQHLGSLFDVSKTNGFLQWKKTKASSDSSNTDHKKSV